MKTSLALGSTHISRHHPENHEAKDQTEQTTLVRPIQEADELVKETVFCERLRGSIKTKSEE